MRNLAHLAARLYGVPLMMLPSAADTFGNTFQAILHGSASLEIGGDKPQAFGSNVAVNRFADKPYAVTDDGIGVLGVYGALLQRHAFDAATCTSMASYQVLQSRLDAMQADPDVRGILLEFDSPGGEVAGNFELARRMLSARGQKPVWSHVNEGAYSAAYSLAAATDRIVVPQAGRVGSIGIVMVHVDQSRADEKRGLAYTFIYAGERKLDLNSHAPLSAEAQARATAEVMRLYDMFTGHVATARSMDQQAVIDTQAGVFPANEARALGLVDDIAGFDETLAELTDHVRTRATRMSAPTAGRMAAGITTKGARMGDDKQAAANTANEPPADNAAVNTARAAGYADGQKAGAAAERTRVAAILRHEAATGRGRLAMTLAMDTDMSAEAAALVLSSAATETAPAATAPKPASPLAAAMATVPNPPISGAATSGDGDSEDPAAFAKNVVALYQTAKGGK